MCYNGAVCDITASQPAVGASFPAPTAQCQNMNVTKMFLDQVCCINHSNYGSGRARRPSDSFSHMWYFSFKTLLMPMIHISSSSTKWKRALSGRKHSRLLCRLICDCSADLAGHIQAKSGICFILIKSSHKKWLLSRLQTHSGVKPNQISAPRIINECLCFH